MSTLTPKKYTDLSTKLGSPINPYLDEDNKIRLSADVAIAHRRQIGSVIPDRGIISDSITAFIYSIVHDIESLNLNYYSPDNEAKLRSLIARRTSLDLNTKTNGGNVTRTTKKSPTGAKRSVSKRATAKKTGRRKESGVTHKESAVGNSES